MDDAYLIEFAAAVRGKNKSRSVIIVPPVPNYPVSTYQMASRAQQQQMVSKQPLTQPPPRRRSKEDQELSCWGSWTVWTASVCID